MRPEGRRNVNENLCTGKLKIYTIWTRKKHNYEVVYDQIVKYIYYLPLILKTAAYGRRSFRILIGETDGSGLPCGSCSVLAE